MSNIAEILMNAEIALYEARWDEAEQLYQQVEDHPKAQQALSQLERLRAVEQQVLALKDRGDQNFQATAYEQASDDYKQALDEAGYVHILKYHSYLEQKRNQALELLSWQKRAKEVQSRADACRQQLDWANTFHYQGFLLETG